MFYKRTAPYHWDMSETGGDGWITEEEFLADETDPPLPVKEIEEDPQVTINDLVEAINVLTNIVMGANE